MKKTLILTIAFFTIISILLGQSDKKTILIKGRVYRQSKNDSNFIPLAIVYIKNTKLNCLTDTLGYYSLDISSFANQKRRIVLACKHVGYVIKEIPLSKIKNSTSTDFILENAPACNYLDSNNAITIKPANTPRQEKYLCDTTTFNKLIRAQIEFFDKLTSEKYFIYYKINCDNDTLPNGGKNSICTDITMINRITSKKGSIISNDNFDNNSTVYFLFCPTYVQKLNSYIVKVRHRNGEWGGATVLYHYKKKGKTFKLIKKTVVSIS